MPRRQAARIRSGKLSFEQAARQVSVGPRAQEGGDVGVVDWNSLDPTWQDRLSQLKPGDVSGLFEVNNGLKGQLKLLSMESGDRADAGGSHASDRKDFARTEAPRALP